MIAKLFGTDNAVKKQLDDIEKYDIPEEEKIKMRIEVFHYYTPFKIAQRYLALIITLLYVILFVIAAAYQYKGLDYQGIITISKAFEIGLVMLAVASFYLGGGAIESFKGRPKY